MKMLSSYIRKKRIEAGMTQAELGKHLGYTSQFVANWEREASSPPAHVMKKLIATLKVPPEEMLDILTEESTTYWRNIILPKKSLKTKKKA